MDKKIIESVEAVYVMVDGMIMKKDKAEEYVSSENRCFNDWRISA